MAPASSQEALCWKCPLPAATCVPYPARALSPPHRQGRPIRRRRPPPSCCPVCARAPTASGITLYASDFLRWLHTRHRSPLRRGRCHHGCTASSVSRQGHGTGGLYVTMEAMAQIVVAVDLLVVDGGGQGGRGLSWSRGN